MRTTKASSVDDTGTGGGGGGTTTTDIVNPPSDRNDEGPPNRRRFYDLTDSLNFAKLNSLELNKIFRLAPLHDGGILEPFFGVRYMKFEDTFQRQNYRCTTRTASAR